MQTSMRRSFMNSFPGNWKSVVFKSCGILILIVVYVPVLRGVDPSSGLSVQELTFEPETTTTNELDFPFRPRLANLCPSTWHLFSGDVTAAVYAAEDFHMQGGNLKTIQEYLDQQIDKTYSRLGVHFEMTSGETIKQGIPKAIYEELVKGDKGGRGGYDQRKLPGKFQPRMHPYPISRLIDVMEETNYDKWKSAIGPIGPNCTSVDRIQQRAQKHYEDKFMCSFYNLSTPTTGDEECHILSIGSNDQWGFESTVLRHAPNCHTHTFDCTLTTPKRKPLSANASFYSICIAGEDRDDIKTGRKYRTYDSLWKMTGMKGPPRLLKMDVEGFEYDVLTSMMPTSANQRDDYLPEQIVVELHYASRMYDLPWMLRARQASEISMLISHMYRAGGYLPVHVDYDPGCAPCLEVLFVKVLCQ